jgi:hypothetical protein
VGGGKPDGWKTLRIHRNKWEYSIKKDIQNLVWGMDWIDLALGRNKRVLVNAGMKFRGLMKYGDFLVYLRKCKVFKKESVHGI